VNLNPPPAPYQVMPPLTAEERAELKADIQANGIVTPIPVDEDGNILDGHNRAEIAAELGIDCPRVVVTGLADDAAKREYALRVNILGRKSISDKVRRDKRRELHQLMRDRGQSIREIAKQTGSPVKTVHRDVTRQGVSGDTPPAEEPGKLRLLIDGLASMAAMHAKLPQSLTRTITIGPLGAITTEPNSWDVKVPPEVRDRVEGLVNSIEDVAGDFDSLARQIRAAAGMPDRPPLSRRRRS
jgi:hypothetical protein